ncbi:hypothetical protein BH10ACI2_BH10ACI2_24660 [soil metagenome]
MFIKFGYKTAWLVLLVIVVAVAAMVLIPVWLIQPFASQTVRQVEISYLLRSWSPVLTIVLAIAAIVLAVYLWKSSRRWFSKIAPVVPLFLVFVFTWFAQQNHFEWMFNPLSNPNFAKASEADFVADGAMVMAVKINGDAVAFPVLQMAYHHVVQDVVGGTPITATY